MFRFRLKAPDNPHGKTKYKKIRDDIDNSVSIMQGSLYKIQFYAVASEMCVTLSKHLFPDRFHGCGSSHWKKRANMAAKPHSTINTATA